MTTEKNATPMALTKPKADAVTIWSLLDKADTKEKFKQVLGNAMTPDKMLRLCINAVRKTPRLGECDPFSVFGAMMSSASLGLEPNTPLGQAYLIPYKKRKKIGNQWVDAYECQFQIGYKGFVALAHRSPKLVKLEAEGIRTGDKFEHEQGSESFLKYKKALEDRGALRGAYCYIEMRTEHGKGEMSVVLPLAEIHKIRAKSETYRTLVRNVEKAENEIDKKKAEDKLADTPWVMWEDDMAAKSAIKKLCKQFPLSPQLVAAARLDELSEEGMLDLSAMGDVEMARSVAEGEVEPETIEHKPEAPMQMVKPEGEKQPVEQEKIAEKKNERPAEDEMPAFIKKKPETEQKKNPVEFKE